MNYILHLNKTFEKFCEDERLTPFHVSLYFSLFQYWNMARFRNPISISRDELMYSAKIGSVNTYIRCIKELDKWQYIKYVPSFNPQKGSQVYLYNFNNSNDTAKQHQNNNTITTFDNGSDISSDKGSNKAAKKTTGKASKTQVIPSINLTNNLNQINNKNIHEPPRRKNNKKSSFVNGDNRKGKKVAPKKECSIPELEKVKNYFAENKWPKLEAEKFFNYYQSNGWLVGGKSPMKNWKAAARNWLLNAEKFNEGKKTIRKPGNLHAKTEKNYGEPL